MQGLVLVLQFPHASGEVHFPIDFAPWPNSRARRIFGDDLISTHLDALEERQQDDGGWRFNWPAWALGPEAEWRGRVTLHALKVLRAQDVAADDAIATLGPEAWPEPPENLRELLDAARLLHSVLRDQRVIAGIGRSWVDEILHTAKLSPFKRGSELSADEAERLREAIGSELGRALAQYEEHLTLPIPDKLPMPLRVHRRNGEPCPRCGDQLEAVFYEDYVMCYCPTCQTDGKLLKDRRLSRLLK